MVAARTHGDVQAIWQQSYALTLYTHWHLEQREQIEAIIRRAERYDAAGLMVLAMRNPAKIAEMHKEFLDGLRPQQVTETKAVREAWVERMLEEHERLVPIDPH